MHQNTYTIAVLKAKQGQEDTLLSTLQGLADATRQEHGCIEYGFYRDASEAGTVVSFERWVDTDAEASHWQTPHLKNALESLGPVLQEQPAIFKTKKVI